MQDLVRDLDVLLDDLRCKQQEIGMSVGMTAVLVAKRLRKVLDEKADELRTVAIELGSETSSEFSLSTVSSLPCIRKSSEFHMSF